jgi:hypothetical protein
VKRAGCWILAAVVALAAAPAARTARAQETASETKSVSGTVTDFVAASKKIEIKTAEGSSMTFVWNSETRFNGVVSAGARVVVRYTTSGGQNLARTIGVAR